MRRGWWMTSRKFQDFTSYSHLDYPSSFSLLTDVRSRMKGMKIHLIFVVIASFDVSFRVARGNSIETLPLYHQNIIFLWSPLQKWIKIYSRVKSWTTLPDDRGKCCVSHFLVFSSPFLPSNVCRIQEFN